MSRTTSGEHGALIGIGVVALFAGGASCLIWPMLSSTLLKPEWQKSYDAYKASHSADTREKNITEAVRLAQTEHVRAKDMLPLLMDYGRFLMHRNRNNEAVQSYRQIINIAIGENNKSVEAEAKSEMGWCQHKMFMDGIAPPPSVKDMESALAMQRSDSTTEPWKIEQTLRRMGEICCDNKQYDVARKYLEECIAMCEKKQVSWDDGNKTLIALARVDICQGRKDEAERNFERAIANTDKKYGGGSDVADQLIRQYAKDLREAGQTELAKKVASHLDRE